ncbi:MAG: alpha/beta fold hydrolase [Reinekea sp.]|nr:alpha/beta fold hydrolase [Reinekea sp.]
MTQALFDYPSYSPGFGLANGHLQSILPSLFRQVEVPFVRSVLELDDGDFLLLDTLTQTQRNAPWVVISHGLEGSSRRHYVTGMARHFYQAGWNVQAWNFRSCGGQLNRLPRFYHSGAIDDLKRVIAHVITSHQAQRVFLVGFSMGGNQTVLTLGDAELPDEVIGGAGFSVPLDLASCADELAKPAQAVYMRRFLKDLKPKIAAKAEQFPERVSLQGYEEIKSFHQFDDRYTAPLHGFNDAQDYWTQCSGRNALPYLRKPTLIVNAADDPFLSGRCYDCNLSNRSTHLFLETPSSGGHVGFARWKLNSELWSEQRALAFANHLLE